MKRPIALSLLLAALGLTAFMGYKHPVTPPSAETLLGINSNDTGTEKIIIKVPEMTELGIPSEQRYSTSLINSRNPWDMAVFDGKLYVGSGDYGLNTGPCDVWRYDPETDKWTNSGTVSDEAVANFEIIDNRLIITGTDPDGSWSNGSFYTCTDDGWVTDRTVPYGVHMFDIAKFQGKTFYGIGNSDSSQSPVQMTADGVNYNNIAFFDGEDALLGNDSYGFSRCYNLFESSNELYAFCTWSGVQNNLYGFFKYDGEAFRLVSTAQDSGVRSQGTNRQVLMNKALTFNGRSYFSTGYFYSTDDFTAVNRISVPDDAYVQDMTVQNGKMYVLTSSNIEKEIPDENGQAQKTTSYKNTVWEYGEASGFTEIYSFEYGLSAMSFEKSGDTYYIGIGQRTDETVTVDPATSDSPLLLIGTIVKVEFVEKIIEP